MCNFQNVPPATSRHTSNMGRSCNSLSLTSQHNTIRRPRCTRVEAMLKLPFHHSYAIRTHARERRNRESYVVVMHTPLCLINIGLYDLEELVLGACFSSIEQSLGCVAGRRLVVLNRGGDKQHVLGCCAPTGATLCHPSVLRRRLSLQKTIYRRGVGKWLRCCDESGRERDFERHAKKPDEPVCCSSW